MKKKILILAGGFSREREISLKTANGVFNQIKKKYNVKICEPNGNLIKNLRSSRPHLINGPTIIPIVNGIIIGERIELKNGAPTEIFLSNITFEKIGYIVPISMVKVKDSIKILFKEMTPSLDKKLISLWFLLSRIFRNFVKPNNVITKSKKSMNKPLLGSLANA